MYIENMQGPEDVKKLTLEQLPVLAEEMRHALLIRASKHGGHFGPNFGMVEATIALHYVFESPKDKIVYDVSHQTYPHKMLTGRKDAYLYEEKYDDVSGYSNPHESEHDFFTVGHTSTSVSLAAGLAKARDLKGEDGNVIAVIGDGSLSGGEALEGLDYAAELDSNFIIVVNDNDMSIAENHGGLYQNLKLLRETRGQAECNLFKAFGLDYIYVDKGNDAAALIDAFKQVKDSKKPVVVHINTLKGKGYAPAEQNKERWHFSGPFDIETGKPLYAGGEEGYEEITCKYLLDKMKKGPFRGCDYLRYTWGYGLYQEQTRRSREAVCGCWHCGGNGGCIGIRHCGKRRQAFFMGCTAHLCREPLTRFRRICASTIIPRRLLPSWVLFMA